MPPPILTRRATRIAAALVEAASRFDVAVGSASSPRPRGGWGEQRRSPGAVSDPTGAVVSARGEELDRACEILADLGGMISRAAATVAGMAGHAAVDERRPVSAGTFAGACHDVAGAASALAAAYAEHWLGYLSPAARQAVNDQLAVVEHLSTHAAQDLLADAQSYDRMVDDAVRVDRILDAATLIAEALLRSVHRFDGADRAWTGCIEIDRSTGNRCGKAHEARGRCATHYRAHLRAEQALLAQGAAA